MFIHPISFGDGALSYASSPFFCANAFSRTGYAYVNFVPTLGKTEVTGNVKDILMLNTSGKLVHPTAAGNMKGFRAYFLMHDAPANAREFIMNFGEGETTGISSLRLDNGDGKVTVYNLQGKPVSKDSQQKGIYIVRRLYTLSQKRSLS